MAFMHVNPTAVESSDERSPESRSLQPGKQSDSDTKSKSKLILIPRGKDCCTCSSASQHEDSKQPRLQRLQFDKERKG